MNELDPDLQFIFEELPKNINFLDINLKGTVMQIEKTLINDRLRVSKIFLAFQIFIILQ